MNILVTGGAGYIGSVLVPMLLEAGHTVTVVDTLMYNQTSLLDCCHHKNFTFINGDARDRDRLKDLLRDADAVLPLACLTGAPLCARDPYGAQSVNFDAIQSILELRKPSQIIIFPTTNSGYGVGNNGIHCTEETPLNPISLYGRLKVEIEKILLASENCLTLRFATLFGLSPRMRLDLLVNDFTYRAVHDRFIILFEAHFKRNYLHVRDAARSFMHSLDHFDAMKGQAYNVGLSDANLSKLELCQEIKKHVPEFYFTEADVGEDIDKRNYIVSNEKIEATGFKPQHSLTEGIAELVKGYRILKRNQFANV
ncbi:putative UDP-glucose 4-epimerase [Nitrospina gracilis 3/211]|uniref:Putative UDP-glucose 4-epimerase n=1 Tax=Nitrospina gracilis (strain 3/211) TaxID=1266370 RepID=M1Z9E8_NITG3|nr:MULTISPECIES: NAD(P)-dependent oxidoreductase [Nitrospina]MCF8722828.1 nucleoside-diphosphate-sugar epimerase [Nitrospina sp. Nb-3]CCQ89786.1 putative UDP-glucose 4-epimerase [Nitrospina gracilis 3/211]